MLWRKYSRNSLIQALKYVGGKKSSNASCATMCGHGAALVYSFLFVLVNSWLLSRLSSICRRAAFEMSKSKPEIRYWGLVSNIRIEDENVFLVCICERINVLLKVLKSCFSFQVNLHLVIAKLYLFFGVFSNMQKINLNLVPSLYDITLRSSRVIRKSLPCTLVRLYLPVFIFFKFLLVNTHRQLAFFQAENSMYYPITCNRVLPLDNGFDSFYGISIKTSNILFVNFLLRSTRCWLESIKIHDYTQVTIYIQLLQE